MLSFFAEGGCGDAFIVVLKAKALNKPCKIYHKVDQHYYRDTITDIYSIFPETVLEFSSITRLDFPELDTDSHNGPIVFFPDIDMISKIKIPKPYVVLQAHSGKHNELNCKKLSCDTINDIIKNSKVPIVLVGNNLEYASIDNCTNLIGKTKVNDILCILKNADYYVGPEGMIAFMALSQRVNSTIFYSSYEAVKKRILGTPWEQYAPALIHLGYKG